MKSRIRDGVFRLDLEHEESFGHYIMAKLDMKNSKLIFYDSYSDDIRKSQYFDFPLISRIIHGMHDYYTAKRKMPPKPLEVFQQPMMHQSGSDCG